MVKNQQLSVVNYFCKKLNLRCPTGKKYRNIQKDFEWENKQSIKEYRILASQKLQEKLT